MQGFIYFQLQPYRALRIKVMNISERKTQEIEIPVAVAFRGTR